jgi:hypothetical protein
MAIFYLDSGSISDLVVSNAQLTGSLLGTASFATSASYAPDNGITVAAGGSTNTVSQLVFSNANNVSFGLAGSTITATAAAGGGDIQSYFEHIPAIQGTSTSAFGTNANLVQPFVLPYNVSVSYIRLPINFSFASSTFASTANTSIVYNQSMTYFANIYSAGSGASSKSIRQLAQASVSLLYQASATEGANSNQQTNNFVFSYFTEGITTATAATTITAPASSVFNFTTNVLSVVSGIRMIDIPFATSLAAGEYWIAFQRSSAFTSTGLAAVSNVSLNNQFGYVSQANINGFGFATNNSTGFQMQPGVGTWSATNQGGTTNSIAFSGISSVSGNPRTPFQFIRFA